jgi:hypothetical protein
VTFGWRIALPTSVAALGSAGAFFLFAADAAYFLEPRKPRDLGDASGLAGDPGTNRHVRLRGVADLTGSLRIGRREGDLRAVRLSGSGVVALVPAPGPPGSLPAGEGGLSASGLFDGSGRLWRADKASATYGPILRRFRERAPVTHLLVAGEAPGSAWAGFAAALVVAALGAVAIALAARAILRRRHHADPGL